MSVLVKGVQMPKNCKECPFLLDNDACYAMNKPNAMFLPLVCNGSTDEYPLNEFPYWEKRVDWCPLVEVPSPHGRLIDADAFKKGNERLLHCDFPYLSEATLEELIDEAPTVIEAEE